MSRKNGGIFGIFLVPLTDWWRVYRQRRSHFITVSIIESRTLGQDIFCHDFTIA
ncbi:hypothetical protein [Limnospira fusiformis]|uniref:hypothetical protein n=1 Tax=Limnospira fusiformis TaxID=54297 RepID=UPI0034E0DFE4